MIVTSVRMIIKYYDSAYRCNSDPHSHLKGKQLYDICIIVTSDFS